jgi:glucose/arabinose dehydrogenase
MRSIATAIVGSIMAGLASAQTPLRLEQVCGGLGVPVLVTSPTGDLHRLFVVEQPGRIRIVEDGVLLPTAFLDLAGTIPAGGEAGLLGLAFHPDYATNGHVFVFHSGNPFPTSIVRRFTVSAANANVADPASAATVLSTAMVYGNHNGGMVGFGPDGMLYVSLGDGGSIPPSWPNDPFNHAQRGDSWLGKMLRIDVDNPSPPLLYGIPADNPFVGARDPLDQVRDEVWSLGLRNPWRFSFDRLTGDLWIADVGGAREEIDFEPAGDLGGRNYGWSCMEGTVCSSLPVCTCFSPALTPPLHEYTFFSNQAIIGGYVYRGSAIPDLRGSYFFADYMQRKFWSLRQVGGVVAQLTDRTAELVAPAGAPILGPTAFGEDARGEMYVCDQSGRVFRIVPNGPVVFGTKPYGTGTAGCRGPHTLAAANSPVIGNPEFTLRCSHGPVAGSGLGLGVFADRPDAGSDPLGWGVLFHVQLASPLLLLSAMLPDLRGNGQFSLSIPADSSLTGLSLFAQGLWIWDPAVCAATPSAWTSSNGLRIKLLP